MKTCAKCHISKPFSFFHKDSHRKDGFQPYCMQCKAVMKRAKAAERREQPVEVDLTATKRCGRCGETKPLSEFHRHRATPDGVQNYCKPCMIEQNQAWTAAHPAERAQTMRKHKEGPGWKAVLLGAARRRSAASGVVCTATVDDFEIPETCPILGMPLVMGKGEFGPDSASLDRFDPRRGYIPGNVWVISRRANQMKSDASPAELLRFAAWVNQQFGEAK